MTGNSLSLLRRWGRHHTASGLAAPFKGTGGGASVGVISRIGRTSCFASGCSSSSTSSGSLAFSSITISEVLSKLSEKNPVEEDRLRGVAIGKSGFVYSVLPVKPAANILFLVESQGISRIFLVGCQRTRLLRRKRQQQNRRTQSCSDWRPPCTTRDCWRKWVQTCI